jgi:phosphoribosylanthranilate isomerase
MPPAVERIGVFGSGSVSDIASAAEEAGLTGVQLHGGVDLEFARLLGQRLGPEIAILETVHWRVDRGPASAREVAIQLSAIAADGARYRVLADAKVGSSPMGGTGKTFDWESAREVLSSQPKLRVIVAGGLTPDNVAEAIRVLKPWGVDVASGVEREPGRKNYAKLKSFIDNARGAV